MGFVSKEFWFGAYMVWGLDSRHLLCISVALGFKGCWVKRKKHVKRSHGVLKQIPSPSPPSSLFTQGGS